MSRRPSLAFNRDDAGLAADLSRRAKVASDRIRTLLPQLKAGVARRAGRVANDLGEIADALHPVVPRFATYATGKRCFVAMIDSQSLTLYRLLPCPKARAFSLGMKQSVLRHKVRHWPTLELAIAFARIETAHRKREATFEDRYWRGQWQRRATHKRAVERLTQRAAKVTT